MPHPENNINNQIKQLVSNIQGARSILLTTHKTCDGDGLGSIVALYHGLNQLGKKTRILTVDPISKKYNFFTPKKDVESYDSLKTPIEQCDLAFICDTNDYRLIEPLYPELNKKCKKTIFIDHHCLLKNSPPSRCNSAEYVVDSTAASTGEIIYSLLKELNLEMNTNMATALYVSILSDTQNFQFIKDSANSYKICGELFPYIEKHHTICHHLFSMKKEKLLLLAAAIKQTEYFNEESIALLSIHKDTLLSQGLNVTDACDFIEISLKVPSIKIAVLIVQLAENEYKLSFRSKLIDVSRLAEEFDGGGHTHSAGAIIKDYKKDIKLEILTKVQKLY